MTALYKKALRCGISLGEFWNYSPREIFDLIGAFNDNYKTEIQNRFMEARVMAFYTAQAVFGGKEEIMPWDYYPGLFRDEKIQYEESRQAEELEIYKERKRKAILAYNKKFQQSRGGEMNE